MNNKKSDVAIHMDWPFWDWTQCKAFVYHAFDKLIKLHVLISEQSILREREREREEGGGEEDH